MTAADLRTARTEAGLTLREIAARIGRTPQRVWQLEHGVDHNRVMAERAMAAIEAAKREAQP